MNRPSVTPNTSQLRLASAYTVLQSISEGSIPFGPTHLSSASWRKFARPSTRQTRSEPVTTFAIVPTERTTTGGPMILKPAPLPLPENYEDYDERIEAFLRFIDSLGSEEPEAEMTEDEAAE